MDWLLEIVEILWKRRQYRPYLFTILVGMAAILYVNSKHNDAMGMIQQQGADQRSAYDRILYGIDHVDKRVDDLFKLVARTR